MEIATPVTGDVSKPSLHRYRQQLPLTGLSGRPYLADEQHLPKPMRRRKAAAPPSAPRYQPTEAKSERSQGLHMSSCSPFSKGVCQVRWLFVLYEASRYMCSALCLRQVTRASAAALLFSTMKQPSSLSCSYRISVEALDGQKLSPRRQICV